MGFLIDHNALPDSNSPDLHLSHPTPDECIEIWRNTSTSWRDSLTLPVYLLESLYLTTVPLAKDKGMTTWILVDKNAVPDKRPILCSCESFRKRSLTSDADGNIEDNMVHGIASVFCPPEYRRRGYAARHMKEMAKALRSWQPEHGKCVGSILYSDIGKTYYANLGWHPNSTNSHVVLQPSKGPKSTLAEDITEGDLLKLSVRDEQLVRKAMAMPAKVNRRLTIVPDLDHMLWHIAKEDFATVHLFQKISRAKGAIAGPPGNQVWAVWTHRYYDHPDAKSHNNVLYILRLVMEGETVGKSFAAEKEEQHAVRHGKQSSYLKAVLQAAQAQAAEWKLDHVELWDPTPTVRAMIAQTEIEHSLVEREEDSIASGLWYDENGGVSSAPLWINNEHFAWL
ncbi:MAG: hypothetical protein LQ340_003685 [Diploschistes diacapsis]|nr:MAG: hypothetical protein LQ340_003685 [Diploschistes diacapsis]